MFRNQLGKSLLAAVALGVVACASDASDAASMQSGEAAEAVGARSYALEAGEQSRALGIARWTIEDDTFRAFDASSQRLAELRQDDDTIHSVFPDTGAIGLRDHSQDNISARSLQFYEALKSDLQQAATKVKPSATPTDTEENIEKGNLVPYACYYYAADCQAVGQNARLLGQIVDWKCDLWSNLCPNQTLLLVEWP